MPIGGFNAYAATLPESKKNVHDLAIEFVQPTQPFDVLSQDMSRAGGSTATVQYDLEDDSVRSIRYELDFARVTEGKVLLSRARVAYKCQQNRGHQDFSPELCI